MSDQTTTSPAAPPATMSLGEALIARSEGRMSAESYEATYAPMLAAAAAAKGVPLTPNEQEHADWRAGREAKLSVDASAAAAEDARLGAAFEQMYAPADSPGTYEIPRIGGVDLTPQEAQWEHGLRVAMHDARVPTFVGNAIAQRFDELGRTLVDGVDGLHQPVTQAQAIQNHVSKAHQQLQSMWGDQHEPRTRQVGEFLVQLGEKHPVVGALLDHAPHMFADPLIVNQLWNFIDRRKP